MRYPTPLIDILQSLVEDLTFTVTINNVETVDETYVLTVCDVYHILIGRTFTYNDVVYTVQNVDADANTVTVTGESEPATGAFELTAPFFFHGTPIATGEDLTKIPKATNKTPMIWVLRPFQERFKKPLDVLERVSDVRIFFLTFSDHDQWSTAEADTRAIQPMRRLAQNFVAALDSFAMNCEKIFMIDNIEYTITDYTRFGVYISNKGVEKSMFADKLAGCELSIALPIWKRQNCSDC